MGQQEWRPNVHLCQCLAFLQSDFIDPQEVIIRRGCLKASVPVSLLTLGMVGVPLGVLGLVNKKI